MHRTCKGGAEVIVLKKKKVWKATLFRILQPNHEQKFCSVYVILRFERIGKLTKIRIIRHHLAVNFYTLQL